MAALKLVNSLHDLNDRIHEVVASDEQKENVDLILLGYLCYEMIKKGQELAKLLNQK